MSICNFGVCITAGFIYATRHLRNSVPSTLACAFSYLTYSQAKLETGSSEGTTMLEEVGKGEVPGAPEEITVVPIAFPLSTQGRQKRPPKMRGTSVWLHEMHRI